MHISASWGRFMTVLAAGAAAMAFATAASATPMHGYCAGVGQCVDNGTNSPTNVNPPSNFGFTINGGPTTGTLYVDVLVPDNALQPIGGFALTGTLSGTASLFSAAPWTSRQLDAYLGIGASPNNPIGAFLPATQALDPGATGFFVYQANLGSATLKKPANSNVSPLENISPNLAVGSYIVGFLDVGGTFNATKSSGAIFETGRPVPTPEPASLAVLGLGLLGLGVARARRR